MPPRNLHLPALTSAVCKRHQLSQASRILVNAPQLTRPFHEQHTAPGLTNTFVRRKRTYAKLLDAQETSPPVSKCHSLVRQYSSICNSHSACPSSFLWKPTEHKRHYSTTPHFEPSSPATPQTIPSFEPCTPPETSDAILRSNQETQQQQQQQQQISLPTQPQRPAPDISPQIKIERFPSSRYTFSTYEMVSIFEKRGRYTRLQSLAITECIHLFLKSRLAQYQGQLLTKSDLENESYLFKAALSELRTELQIHRRNDTANLKSDVNAVMREVDSLHIKLREDMTNLKSDIAMEMNTRKAEMSENAKKTEFGMLEANNRYTVELSDVRTEIEQMKWQTTKKAATFGYCAVVTLLLCGYLFMSGGPSPNAEGDNQKQVNEDDPDARIAGSTNSMKVLEGPQGGIAGPGM